MTEFDFVKDAVHRETQVHEQGFDLTVSEIHRVSEPGKVDFGGGELEDAEVEAVDTRYRDADDDYGWWNLEGGRYLMTYNEEFEVEEPVRLESRRELLERGGSHPSVEVVSPPRMPLTVVDGGLSMKENARVTTMDS